MKIIWSEIGRIAKTFSGQRKGQALMNALRTVDHALYEEVTATDIDPFYNDSKIPAFKEWIKAKEQME